MNSVQLQMPRVTRSKARARPSPLASPDHRALAALTTVCKQMNQSIQKKAINEARANDRNAALHELFSRASLSTFQSLSEVEDKIGGQRIPLNELSIDTDFCLGCPSLAALIGLLNHRGYHVIASKDEDYSDEEDDGPIIDTIRIYRHGDVVPEPQPDDIASFPPV